jgi:hypothetical protein
MNGRYFTVADPDISVEFYRDSYQLAESRIFSLLNWYGSLKATIQDKSVTTFVHHDGECSPIRWICLHFFLGSRAFLIIELLRIYSYGSLLRPWYRNKYRYI